MYSRNWLFLLNWCWFDSLWGWRWFDSLRGRNWFSRLWSWYCTFDSFIELFAFTSNFINKMIKTTSTFGSDTTNLLFDGWMIDKVVISLQSFINNLCMYFSFLGWASNFMGRSVFMRILLLLLFNLQIFGFHS